MSVTSAVTAQRWSADSKLWTIGIILGLLKVKTFDIRLQHHLVVPLTDASNRIARW